MSLQEYTGQDREERMRLARNKCKYETNKVAMGLEPRESLERRA